MSFKTPLALSLIALALSLGACGDNSTPTATTQPTATAPAGDMTAAMKAEADKLLADVANYIKDNKWDLADKAVARLDELKPNLPTEYGSRIDDIKNALATAKAAAAKIPAGVKLGG